MPSQLAEQFGTTAWFDQIPVLLPTEVPGLPRFVVEHQATDPIKETVVHQQIFSQDKLVCWIPGRATQEADLTVIRPAECDAGDLLGRLPAAEVLTQTSVMVGHSPPTCALGIANTSRPGLQEVTAGTVDVRLEVLSTPFGDTKIAIRLNPDGSQHLVDPSNADSDIEMRLKWASLTEWIHTDTGLGPLINRGDIVVDGPMFKLSYIEGHISWPRHPQDHQHRHRFKTAMDTYAQILSLIHISEPTRPY